MVKALHDADIEVILDVVYNHTAEGNEKGPTIAFRGIDNATYYRLVDGDQAALLRHHRHRQQPADAQPARAAADHGLAALLGAGDARRRVPVRPGRDPGPAVPRGGQAVGVLRHHPAGPGDLPGEADRRAVGPRRRRIPGRQLPAAVDASGTASTATPSATSGAGSRRHWPSSRPGSPARATCTPTPTGGRPRRSTSSSPTTASPCAISCPTTRSTTRPTARAATTGRATTAPGTAASRARPTIPAINALRLRQQRNFITTLMVSQGVPMLAHGDELGRTQRGNNNVYAQDNELSWVDWDLTPTRRTCSTSPPAAIALRKAHPVLRRRRFFAGDARHGGKSSIGDIEWFKPDGSPMDDDDWNSGFARSVMVFLNGDAHSRAGPHAAGGSPTTTSCCCSTPTPSRSASPCHRRRSATTGSSGWTPRTGAVDPAGRQALAGAVQARGRGALDGGAVDHGRARGRARRIGTAGRTGHGDNGQGVLSHWCCEVPEISSSTERKSKRVPGPRPCSEQRPDHPPARLRGLPDRARRDR